MSSIFPGGLEIQSSALRGDRLAPVPSSWSWSWSSALLMLAIFIPLGRKVASGRPPRGRFWNLFEAIVLFVRDEVARPAIGRHDADRFLPFLWTSSSSSCSSTCGAGSLGRFAYRRRWA